MASQYSAQSEDLNVGLAYLPVSNTSEEQYVQEDLNYDFSANSMLFVGGFNSSGSSSDMSDFASFSDLGYNENPSSIFYQSLGIFDEATYSATAQGYLDLNLLEGSQSAEDMSHAYDYASNQSVGGAPVYDNGESNGAEAYDNSYESPGTIRQGHNGNAGNRSSFGHNDIGSRGYNNGFISTNDQNGNLNYDGTDNHKEGDTAGEPEEKETAATVLPIPIRSNVQHIAPDGYIDQIHDFGGVQDWNINNGFGPYPTVSSTWGFQVQQAQQMQHGHTPECTGVNPALTMGPDIRHSTPLAVNLLTEAVTRGAAEKDAAEKDAAEKDAAEKDAAEKDAAKNAAEKDAAEKDAAERHTTEEDLGDEPAGKKERKAKPISKRFQPLGRVAVIPSYVQCLNIVLDYNGYTGSITRVVLNNSITNVAFQPHDSALGASLMRKPLEEYYPIPKNEELVGSLPEENSTHKPISIVSGILQRKIHFRDISSILNSVSSIIYVKSTRFNINNPYEPQYYRYELDAKGKMVNESKCGLCPFCPAVKFLPFKNSSYLSHMTLEHGIFASNFVVPEGLYYGRYRMMRSSDKSRTVKALQCPSCFQVIEVACWKNKSNPLLSYFRHFKKHHSNLNKTFMSSTIDPVMLKHRGGSSFKDSNHGLPVHQ